VELSGDTFHIGEKAFNHCYSLSQIYLGASLRSIGPCAFLECRSLKDVRLPGTLRFVG
jgi:hypothetical protein